MERCAAILYFCLVTGVLGIDDQGFLKRDVIVQKGSYFVNFSVSFIFAYTKTRLAISGFFEYLGNSVRVENELIF